jgi:hypothetical protein
VVRYAGFWTAATGGELLAALGIDKARIGDKQDVAVVENPWARPPWDQHWFLDGVDPRA